MHYVAFVLFDRDEWPIYVDRPAAFVRKRIRRYSSHQIVPEYRTACSCMGAHAHLADKVAFECRHATNIAVMLWTGLGLCLTVPDTQCTHCGGSGRRVQPTRLNPVGRYDYWQIRGFHSWLQPEGDGDDPDAESVDDGSSDDGEDEAGPIRTLVQAIRREQAAGPRFVSVPSAIITPDQY